MFEFTKGVNSEAIIQRRTNNAMAKIKKKVEKIK